MIEVSGRHNSAICYTDALEPAAKEQIQAVCDQPVFTDCKIRVMPDVHAGKGCTIGTTMTITDKVVPGMVGVDIGCGMETVKLAKNQMDYVKLDRLIRNKIPAGREVRDSPHPLNSKIDLDELRCARFVNLDRARRSIGTLGGGNHFIEVDQAENGDLYLIVHSGSRHLGAQVADYYQKEAFKALCGNSKRQLEETIAALKAEGRERDIAAEIDKLKTRFRPQNEAVPQDLAYAEGSLFDDYIHDMKITQYFATLNRQAMTEVILRGMGQGAADRFTTIHNYIDTEALILRKGAVSAKQGERLLIPINMRDGSLICTGLGNNEWNQSAPHGAGRLMSRKAAFARLSLEEYRSTMEGIFTTSVSPGTLDESPMAYKSIEEIIAHIAPTAKIIERIRPTYNFKAG
jgi:RNA-splicing ligase RtcB